MTARTSPTACLSFTYQKTEVNVNIVSIGIARDQHEQFPSRFYYRYRLKLLKFVLTFCRYLSQYCLKILLMLGIEPMTNLIVEVWSIMFYTTKRRSVAFYSNRNKSMKTNFLWRYSKCHGPMWFFPLLRSLRGERSCSNIGKGGSLHQVRGIHLPPTSRISRLKIQHQTHQHSKSPVVYLMVKLGLYILFVNNKGGL